MQILLGSVLHMRADDGQLEWLPDAALLIDAQGRISAKGPAEAIRRQWPAVEVQGYPGDVLLPGFIDTHIHFPQMDMIGSCAPSLLPWLEEVTFPQEQKFRGRTAFVATAAEQFAAELAQQGTSTAVIYSSSDEQATELLFEALAVRGLRAIVGKVSMDQNGHEALHVPLAQDLSSTERLIARWHGREERLYYALTPRFAPSCSPALLEALARFAAEDPTLYVQTHYAENHAEIRWVRELFPGSHDYLAVYESFGLIGPKTILAHAIHTSADERQRLVAQRAVLSHCPTSNLFLGSGLCPVRTYLDDAMAVTLGTDVGAGTSFSLWQTMNEAYKVAQLRGERVSVQELFDAATRRAATALGWNHVGSLDPGYEADIQVIDPRAKRTLLRRWEQTRNAEDRLAALVHLVDDRCLRQLYVRGRCVRDRAKEEDR